MKNLISTAALKMNFDKKVRFGEQLAFKLDNPPLFAGEEPAPIEFKNNLKPGMPRPKTGKSKKGKKQKKFGVLPDYLMKKKGRPDSAQAKQAKPLPEWNLDIRS